MNDSIEQLFSDLYRIEIPLPGSPLKALNSYLIKGDGRFLLIDTGWNFKECHQAMISSLERLAVDLNRTDFFITHLHADHLGLVSTLVTPASRVYFSELETEIMNLPHDKKELRMQKIHDVFASNGFPEDQLRESLARHPGRRYRGSQVTYTPVKENDKIDIGDYHFRCVETPGHSPGHMCLYDAERKIFVSGDHILFDITPNITYWVDLENALKAYLQSLEKVKSLDVTLVLPAHRSLMNNHVQRVRELEEHHQNRIAEVISSLSDGGKNVFQVAPYVTWDIDCKSWEEFPPQQKWFAFGETLAHLKYLEGKGILKQEVRGSRVFFRLDH